MSVQIYSNSPVVSTSSDLGLHKHSIPYYDDDDATESKDQTNGAFNEITQSFDKESCSNPLYRTVSFFTSIKSGCNFQALLMLLLVAPCSTIRKAGTFSDRRVYDGAGDHLPHLPPFSILVLW